MQILKNRLFHDWANEIGLSDAQLTKAIDEMMQGLYEANLGGSIYKKRISVGGRGKRGGVRTIVAFRAHKKAIFVYGFAKNKRDNITVKEEEALKALAKNYFSYDEKYINQAIKIGEFIEVQV